MQWKLLKKLARSRQMTLRYTIQVCFEAKHFILNWYPIKKRLLVVTGGFQNLKSGLEFYVILSAH